MLSLAWAAGCATVPPDASPGGGSRPVPEVPTNQLRADRAILDAFFRANGLRLSAADMESIIPPAARHGHMDRNALRRAARSRQRVLMAIKADETWLWRELDRNRPLLIMLPPGTTYSATAAPVIPVAWDRRAGLIELLDGNGEIQSLPEREFFARREPLRHAALCLVRPGGVRRMDPSREQQLVLADFWFHQGNYRRAQAAYDAVQDASPTGTDFDALMGRGNILVRKKRYREAIPVFREALSLAPDHPVALNNLAYAMMNGDGELLVALRHATKAHRLDPNNPLILETIGSLNLRLGDAPPPPAISNWPGPVPSSIPPKSRSPSWTSSSAPGWPATARTSPGRSPNTAIAPSPDTACPATSCANSPPLRKPAAPPEPRPLTSSPCPPHPQKKYFFRRVDIPRNTGYIVALIGESTSSLFFVKLICDLLLTT